MLFNSLEFAAFLAVLLPLYYRLGLRAQNVLLLLASYLFYGWWDWRFLSLLAVSTAVDFTVGRALGRSEDATRRKRLVQISLATNLGILGFFKYFGFFVDSAAAALGAAGLHVSLPALSIVLPVGISFYTFQTMAYTIDIYRRKETPTDDIVAFAVYVAYFPQLVAGPIERSTNLLPRIQSPRHVTANDIQHGAQLILFGLLKKVAIADAVAPLVDQAFGEPSAHGPFALLLGVYLFALQIYGDFSGYSDIARGTSRLLGIELIINFRQPYLSAHITEFWRRWHMSLSSWLRDYLYISLGGNRGSTARTRLNLMLTMLLGGLWHGAGWNFVVWGGLHGAYLGIHKLLLGARRARETTRNDLIANPLQHLLKVVATFHLVCLAWVFFRAADFATALRYLQGIVAPAPGARPAILQWWVSTGCYAALVIALDLLMWWRDAQVPTRSQGSWAWRGLAYGLAVAAILWVGTSEVVPFIYFQF